MMKLTDGKNRYPTLGTAIGFSGFILPSLLSLDSLQAR